MEPKVDIFSLSNLSYVYLFLGDHDWSCTSVHLQGKARQGEARQGKAKQGKARQGRRVEIIDGKYGRVVCFMFDVWFEKKEGDQYQYIDNVRC